MVLKLRSKYFLFFSQNVCNLLDINEKYFLPSIVDLQQWLFLLLIRIRFFDHRCPSFSRWQTGSNSNMPNGEALCWGLGRREGAAHWRFGVHRPVPVLEDNKKLLNIKGRFRREVLDWKPQLDCQFI